MEIAFEGRLTKNMYFLAELLLKSRLFFTGLGKSVKTYWDEDERAPMVEVNSSGLLYAQVRKLEKICLNSDFMLKFSS